jgi:hypothetical protein
VWKTACLLAILFAPAAASAQSVFVQGSGGREIKRFSGEPDQDVFAAPARGAAIAVTGSISPHCTIGLELDLGGRSTVERTTSVAISGQPREIHTRYTSRRRSASPMIGYQTTPRHAVQIGYYAGLSFSAVSRDIASDAGGIVSGSPQSVSTFTDRVTGAIVGVDVAIRVAPHIAVVPSVRAQGLALSGDLHGHSIRPSIGARLFF